MTRQIFCFRSLNTLPIKSRTTFDLTSSKNILSWSFDEKDGDSFKHLNKETAISAFENSSTLYFIDDNHLGSLQDSADVLGNIPSA